MSDLQNEITEIELTIQEGKDLMAKRDRILRLSKNKDFQEAIEKDFLEGEAIRLTHLYTDNVVMSDPELREKVHVDLQSVGFLKRHLATVITLGDRAQDAMFGDQETLDALRYEEAHPEEFEGTEG